MLELLLLLSCCLDVQAEEVSYRYRIDAPAQPPETGIYRFAPTAEQLYNLGGVPERIRVRDRQGKIVPYLRRPVWVERMEPALVDVAARVGEVREKPDGSLEVVCRLDGSGLPLHELVVRTGMKDFEQKVEVWGRTTEDEDWRPVLTDGFIFDSTRNLKARNTTLRLPEECRLDRFRLVFSRAALERRSALRKDRRGEDGAQAGRGEGDGPAPRRFFKIDGILFRARTLQKVVRQPSYLGFVPAEQKAVWNPKDRSTAWRLRPDFHPLAGVRFHCSDRNFSRRVSVTAEGCPPVRGRIFSVDLPGYRNADADLLLKDPGAFPQWVEAVVLHGDDPPLEDMSLEWILPEHEYVLLAGRTFFPLTVFSVDEEGGPEYGQEKVIREAMGRLEPVTLPLVQGGGRPRSLATAKARPARDPRGWMLWAALAVAVAAMGYGIAAAGRRTEGLAGRNGRPH